jgi:hypothetical protein
MGCQKDIPILATDPDANPILLTLGRSLDFATLTDHGNGTGVLHLAPTWSNLQPCPYPIRMIAADTPGDPSLSEVLGGMP